MHVAFCRWFISTHIWPTRGVRNCPNIQLRVCCCSQEMDIWLCLVGFMDLHLL